MIFDLGGDSLQRIPMHEPLKGTESMTRALVDECATANELVDQDPRLTRHRLRA